MSVSPFSSAHRIYVKSLYKRMLKNEMDWVIRWDHFRGRALAIRAEFERNRSVPPCGRLSHFPQVALWGTYILAMYMTHELLRSCFRRRRPTWQTEDIPIPISVCPTVQVSPVSRH